MSELFYKKNGKSLMKSDISLVLFSSLGLFESFNAKSVLMFMKMVRALFLESIYSGFLDILNQLIF